MVEKAAGITGKQMNISCPHCGQVFPIDESGYSALLAQVRDKAFEKEVEDRGKLLEKAQEAAVRAAEEHIRQEMTAQAAEKERALQSQISELQSALDLQKGLSAAEVVQQTSTLQAQVAELKSKLEAQQASAKTAQDLAVAQAVEHMREQRDALAAQVQVAEAKALQEKTAHEAQMAEAERVRLDMLRLKEEEIERLRDMKSKLSTKMLGESLEQHCEIEFNKVRAMAFPHAHFGKDTKTAEGTKGDYVFRESDESGLEFISIMFEMKTEADTTATKQKNVGFFEKLDKDRNKKGCEYAILVSTLESENEYYNQGIVEVTDYPKMYVIRPQFFIPMIGLLRNMALASLADRRQLAQLQNRDYDIAKFEEKLDKFRSGFGKNMELASRKFEAAIKDIDKSIDALQRVKDELLSSQRALGHASDKVENLTVKRLTYGNPTMKQKFEEARILDGPEG